MIIKIQLGDSMGQFEVGISHICVVGIGQICVCRKHIHRVFVTTLREFIYDYDRDFIQ